MFRVAPDLNQLYSDMEEIKNICKQSVFLFKEWIISGPDVPKRIIGVKLPHQIRANGRCLSQLGCQESSPLYQVQLR